MTDPAMVIEGVGIQAYRYIATLYGLRMEIEMADKYGIPPTACPTRGQALASANRIIHENNLGTASGGRRTRKKALAMMEALCKEKGYIGGGDKCTTSTTEATPG